MRKIAHLVLDVAHRMFEVVCGPRFRCVELRDFNYVVVFRQPNSLVGSRTVLAQVLVALTTFEVGELSLVTRPTLVERNRTPETIIPESLRFLIVLA